MKKQIYVKKQMKQNSCEERASKILTISDEAFFVLKLQRLSYYCNDSETYRLLECSGVGVDAEKFNLQIQKGCCQGRITTDEIDLFVPVRVDDVLFAYIIRFRNRESTYIIFSTAWQLHVEKWRLCFKQQVNADGWHSGLFAMYQLFRDHLFAIIQKLHPLQSDSMDWSQPVKYFNFMNHSLVLSGLSAGCPLVCMFIHDLLTNGLVPNPLSSITPFTKPIQAFLFGSPRFATPDLVKWFMNRSNQVCINRIVNPMDPVPTVPTRKRGYCHISPALIIPEEPKPNLGKGLRWVPSHGRYFSISFLSPTMKVISDSAETFIVYWWIFLIVILVLVSLLLLVIFAAPRLYYKKDMKKFEILVRKINTSI